MILGGTRLIQVGYLNIIGQHEYIVVIHQKQVALKGLIESLAIDIFRLPKAKIARKWSKLISVTLYSVNNTHYLWCVETGSRLEISWYGVLWFEFQGEPDHAEPRKLSLRHNGLAATSL